MGIKLVFQDVDGLSAKLAGMAKIPWRDVLVRNMAEIEVRAKTGGTPVRTGELRMSGYAHGLEFGYVKDYAPHVEYGHRTVNGGWVPGQRYLEKNVKAQKAILENDIKQLVVNA